MLKDRFIQARIAANLSQAALAELAHVSQTAIYKIESGETTKPRRIEKYAQIMNVDPAWLEYGVGEAGTNNLVNEQRSYYPDMGVVQVYFSGRNDQWLMVDKRLLRPPGRYSLVEVADDDLHPILQRRDVVLVNESAVSPAHDNIFAINTYGMPLIRKVFFQPNSLLIGSAGGTSSYSESISMEEADERIIGRVEALVYRDLSIIRPF